MRSRRRIARLHLLVCAVFCAIAVWMLMFCFRNRHTTGYNAFVSSTRSQLQTLRSQIELFKVTFNRAPDFSKGWRELIDARLLSAEPIGIMAGAPWHSGVATSLDEVHDAGDAAWYYDDRGRLYPICSASFARRYPPKLCDIQAIVLPDGPIRGLGGLMRPFSATRAAVIRLGWVVASGSVFMGIWRLIRRSAVLVRGGRLVAGSALWLIPVVLFGALWITTDRISVSGDPDGDRDRSGIVNRAAGVGPYALFVVLGTVVVTLTYPLTVSERRRVAVRLIGQRHRCAKCGYDTRESPQRCSECGAAIGARRGGRTSMRRGRLLGLFMSRQAGASNQTG